MRALIDLQNLADQKDVSNEFHKIQGYVYSLIKEAGFPGIHEKKGYKPFSFSNLFPYGDQKKGAIQHLIIASPNNALIEAIIHVLQINNSREIHIGDCSYTINQIRSIIPNLATLPLQISTSTPIILRIPENNYDRYAIPLEERMKRYIYWRPRVSFEAFVKQLTENLVKKYNDYYGTEIECNTLFERYYFRKVVNTRIIIDSKSYGVAGSQWSFEWQYLSKVQKKILSFAIDAGFGERNSMGFGFVNPSLESKKIMSN